jgi:hypothetical protein
LAAAKDGLGKLCELRAAVIDDRHVHRAEHAVRHRTWTGNLEEMTSLMLHPDLPLL